MPLGRTDVIPPDRGQIDQRTTSATSPRNADSPQHDMRAIAVDTTAASAPPHRFAGGGYWEAMHGDMGGWFEVRVDGPKPSGGKGRHHYRLYCLLDFDAEGADKPLLVVVTGMDKPFRTSLSDADYAIVRRLGDEYRRRNPRSVA